jgi:transcriptional regulator with XRE-family HTH domain
MKSKRKKTTYSKESYEDICQRFIDTRVDKELTQQNMAEILQIPVSTVKQIETFRQAPTISIIRRWATKLNKSYKWIMDGK